MYERRRTRMAAYVLLLVLFLSSSQALAITLPNPPDRTAAANNQTGSLANSTSFSGGVSLVDDGTTQLNKSGNEFVAEYLCIAHPLTLTKQYTTAIGESISGPLTAAQTSGFISAENSVRPPRAVTLSIPIGGEDLGGNISYEQTGLTYNVTTYSVWVTTPQSAEQRIGYIVVSLPVQPQVVRNVTDLSGSSCDSYGMSRLGAGFENGAAELDISYQSGGLSLGNPLAPFSTPPEGGFGPIFTYGTIKVLSSAGVAGAAVIRPGENATFVLPPGSYSAMADVTLFGISFSMGSGKYSSSAGATTADFAVPLTSVYGIWYGLELVALVILIVVLWILARLFRLRELLTQGSKRLVRAARSGWRTVWD